MSWKQRTLLVALSVPFLILAILVYDAIAIHYGGTEASISSLLITSAYQMPFMVFCIGLFIGILGGHLFWRMKANNDTRLLGLDEKQK